MRGVGAVAAPLERVVRRVERLHRRGEVARDQRDLGLGDRATRARDGLARAEAARRASEQRLGAVEIAELRHRDAAQRQRRRIVAQGDIIQRAERVARGERARAAAIVSESMRNRDTLVTPTSRRAGARIAAIEAASPPGAEAVVQTGDCDHAEFA